jgi:hypothetical protein
MPGKTLPRTQLQYATGRNAEGQSCFSKPARTATTHWVGTQTFSTVYSGRRPKHLPHTPHDRCCRSAKRENSCRRRLWRFQKPWLSDKIAALSSVDRGLAQARETSAALRPQSVVALGGTTIATNLPRRVIPTSSPRETHRSTSDE